MENVSGTCSEHHKNSERGDKAPKPARQFAKSSKHRSAGDNASETVLLKSRSTVADADNKADRREQQRIYRERCPERVRETTKAYRERLKRDPARLAILRKKEALGKVERLAKRHREVAEAKAVIARLGSGPLDTFEAELLRRAVECLDVETKRLAAKRLYSSRRREENPEREREQVREWLRRKQLEAPGRRAAQARAARALRKERDPEGFRASERARVLLYTQRHPERCRERWRKRWNRRKSDPLRLASQQTKLNFERKVEDLRTGKKRLADAQSARAHLLSADVVYAAANAALPRTLPRDVRDEALSEIYLAVMTRALPFEEIPKKAAMYVGEAFRLNGELSTLSLDAINPHTGRPYVDDVQGEAFEVPFE